VIRRKLSLVPLVLFLLPLAMSGITLEVHAQPFPTRSIAVSVSSLAGIVQEVGGSHYNTTVLLDQETEPHAFTVTPEIIATADAADLLVFTGHFHWEEELANLTSTPFITFQVTPQECIGHRECYSCGTKYYQCHYVERMVHEF
jgi:ABC-type Zn uptake system ZnuABC Zn-binding protein ZnuA